MKIITTAEALAGALQGNVAEGETSIPILRSARIRGNRVITSDLDLYCVAELEAKFPKDFDCLVPCQQLLDLLKGQTGPLTLEYVSSDKLHCVQVEYGGALFTFDLRNTSNFPVVPEEPLLTIEFDGREFRKMVERVFFAVSNEESRYTLNGALLKFKDGKVHMVATDGRRLGLVESDANNAPPTRDVLLVRSALKWIMENIQGNVSLRIGTDFHAVKTGSKTLIFRKLVGQFPHYEAVIPKEDEITVTATFLSIRRLRDDLSRVARFSDSRSGAVKWIFGKESRIEAKHEDRGAASCPIDCFVGGELSLAWNAQYILDLLGIAEDGIMTIRMQDAQRAALFSLDGMQYVVMPMRM